MQRIAHRSNLVASAPHSRAFLLLGFALLIGSAHANDSGSTQGYTGTAYPRSGTSVLYREVHYIYTAQGEQRQLVMYECPDGAPFARKLLHNSPASAAPDFDFIDGRSGYREGVRGNSGDRQVYVQKNKSTPEQTQKLPETQDAVIDAGFDTYVHDHWDAVGKGDMTVPFLVPSRMSYMKVSLGGSADSSDQRPPVRTMHMKLAAWYGFALPTIDLTYTSNDHRLWRFEGIGSIRDNQGRNQNVRIEFPINARRDSVDQAEVDKALEAPLNGRCDG